ncbi:MAG: hypothetical protein Tsb0014_38170 [Pleurocapsa sp.]
MENVKQNKPDKNILNLKRAKAWIITLGLGIAVCFVAIAYSLITHNPAISFLDTSLFKPGLVWLGCIGFILAFVSLMLFFISDSIVRFLPDKKPLDNITIIIGIFLLLLSYLLLFVSYNIENQMLNYLCGIFELTGTSILFLQEVIKQKFNKLIKIWKLTGTILIFIGYLLLMYSFDT